MNQPGTSSLELSQREKSFRISTRFLRLGLFLCFALTAFCQTKAQQSVNYAIHANIIYHFTKYVDWPEEKIAGDFVISIVGESPLFDELKSFVANKKVGGRKIYVNRVSASAKSFNCHILFISEEESDNLGKISSATYATPLLIVSESEGLAKKGACINFNVVNEHLKLEINKDNIEQRGLSIASELLKLGKIVR